MNFAFNLSISYCFFKQITPYWQITRPATPRAELRLRTAHPGGLLVSWPWISRQGDAA